MMLSSSVHLKARHPADPEVQTHRDLDADEVTSILFLLCLTWLDGVNEGM